MLTIRQTTVTERTLETPDEIAAYLANEHRRRNEAAPFRYGDRVILATRDGIPPQFVAGDVGIVLLCDPEVTPLTTILMVTTEGYTGHFVVPTTSLRSAD